MASLDISALLEKASLALQRQDRGSFVTAATALVGAKAAIGANWKAVAQSLVDFGELSLARRAMELYARWAGWSPAALFDQALNHAQSARPADAIAVLDKIGRSVPDKASNAYLRGTLALNLGDFATAKRELLEANTALPTSGQILQTLSTVGSIRNHPEIAERILAAEKPMVAAPESDRATYLYALGKVRHELGDFDRAFAAFAVGAAIIAKTRRYDARADETEARAAVRDWNSARIETIAARVTAATSRPICVTGLPRSGSTLVEQVLVSHSAVSEGDELMRFGLVAREMGGADATSVERWMRVHAPDEASRLYLHLVDERFGTEGRVVDKTLEASRRLGLTAALLPEAPILWMRRNPLDCAWSCFRTYFLLGLPWSFDQTALAAHLKLEDELLDRWREILGDRLMIVDYEGLVSDKELWIPKILRHCGLAIEPQVFTPEKTKRLVSTNSVAQVRQPINSAAIDSAGPYRKHLQPFIDAYGYEG
ncbi:sulfotransferase [soil metagenome]